MINCPSPRRIVSRGPVQRRWIPAFAGMTTLLLTLSHCTRAEWTQPNVLKDIRFDQKLGEKVPLDVMVINEAGETVPLRRYFGDKPVILNLVYYGCPSLCTEVLNGLLRSLRVLKTSPGEEFNVVTLSFDPKETPELAAKKGHLYRQKYERPVSDDGWPFMTAKEPAIASISQAVGFRYVYDAKLEQYAHAAGLVILTPDGTVSRYLFGVEYSPKDMRLALAEASEGKVGGLAEQILLYCYRYDPETGRYGLMIMRLVRLGGLLTLFMIGAFVFMSIRKERRARAA